MLTRLVKALIYNQGKQFMYALIKYVTSESFEELNVPLQTVRQGTMPLKGKSTNILRKHHIADAKERQHYTEDRSYKKHGFVEMVLPWHCGHDTIIIS